MRKTLLAAAGAVGLSAISASAEEIGDRFCAIQRVDGRSIETSTSEISELVIRCLGEKPIPGTEDMACALVEWSPGKFYSIDRYTECIPLAPQDLLS